MLAILSLGAKCVPAVTSANPAEALVVDRATLSLL